MPKHKAVQPMGDGGAFTEANVWIKDTTKAWCVAKVLSKEDDSVTVMVHGDNKGVSVNKGDTLAWDPSHSLYLDDAAKLSNLHSAALLSLLRRRFEDDDIYTYTGNVLISVNPYKNIPLLYEIPLDNKIAISRRVSQEPVRKWTPLEDEDLGDDSDEDDYELDTRAGQDQGTSPRQLRALGRSPKGAKRRMSSNSVLDQPHVYAIADKAHKFMTVPENRRLTENPRDQSIIITGESGAGKTEAAKYVMRYLISASQAAAEECNEPTGGWGIEECLMESTVLLEAFGNAKTVRNDNSSRFGKYIKLHYDKTWKLVGAVTLNFLLEKSRLVYQDAGERNYHVFYQLCKGLPEEKRKKLYLNHSDSYEGLRQGGVMTQSDCVDDAVEFGRLEKSMDVLQISREEQDSVWQILAALLHMGNIKFIGKEDNSQGGALVSLDSPDLPVADLASMLGLPTGLLVESIRTKSMLTGKGSKFSTPLNAQQASENLQALIKYTYGQLFSWIVGKVNTSMMIRASSPNGGSASEAFIGILDIFGFEIMVRNSFEQLCINFANEVLQQQFNQHVFVLEQEIYASEGLDWTNIDFKTNQGVIDLVAKKPTGLLIQLEEINMLGRNPDNKALLQTYHNTHLGKNSNYKKPRFAGPQFIIVHFAGEVTYDSTGLLEKNNDSLHDTLLDLLDCSTDGFVRELMDYVDPHAKMLGAEGEAGQGLPSLHKASLRKVGSRRENKAARHNAMATKGKVQQIATTVTVSKAFRGQLDDLMKTLRATEPHYIKCIKPNKVKAAHGFSPHLVLQQLNYSGVLEVVRIRREGFPVRMPFVQFYDSFYKLAIDLRVKLPPPSVASKEEARKGCEAILDAYAGDNLFQVGKTQVFLKEDALERLRGAVRGTVHKSAVSIQNLVRNYMHRKRMCKAATDIQREYRAHMRRVKKEAETVKLQALMRARLTQKNFLRQKQACISLQAAARVIVAKNTAQRIRRDNAATKIAACWRGAAVRSGYMEKKWAAIKIQALFKRIVGNLRLQRGIADAFKFAKEGNVNAVANTITEMPELLFVRNRHDRYKTLLQTAVAEGHASLASLLDPLPEDIWLQDADGNTAMHHAAGSAAYDLVKFLAAKANSTVLTVNANGTIDFEAERRRALSPRMSLRVISEARRAACKSKASRTGGVVNNHKAKAVVQAGAKQPVHSGYLLKRRETGTWRKRWCVLTEKQFAYYHSRDDHAKGKPPANHVQLEDAMLKKSDHSESGSKDVSGKEVEHCFELHSTELLRSKRNKEGRLYFRAQAGEQMYEWLVPLRVMVGSHNMKAGNESLRFVNTEQRKFLVQIKNKAGETPLHFAAKFEDKITTEASVVGRVQVGSWLVECGSDVNAASKAGETPLHMALKSRHVALAAALARKGADLMMKTNDGECSMDLLEGPAEVEQIAVGYYKPAERHPLLDAPARLSNLTYVSLHVENIQMHSTDGLSVPFITMSVHDAQGRRVEPMQDIISPVVTRPNSLWWCSNWNMQTPLENMGAGSCVVFELKDQKTATNEIRCLGWAIFHLDPSTMTSQELSLELYNAPVDLSLRSVVPADSFLMADVYMTTGPNTGAKV